jgi:glycosyltransferase involved in cell wall biosynthesis
MKRVLCITSGRNNPSSRFRVAQWRRHAEARGVTLAFAYAMPPLYRSYKLIGWRSSDWLRRLKRRLDVHRALWGNFDAVLIERQVQGDGDAKFEPLFRNVARRLVLDVDDAVHETYPDKYRAIVPLMDEVICGNELLRQSIISFGSKHTTIIPTCIDTDRFVPAASQIQGGVCRLGWIATSSNLPFFLDLKPALLQAARACPFELHVMTDPSPLWEELRAWPIHVTCHAWSAQKELVFVQECDVGLMPLPDTSWARQKCGFKLLLSMACGRPVIASPVGANRDIARDGVDGLWATSTDDWASAITRLVASPDLRAAMGTSGRQRVVEDYSLDAWAERWIQAVLGEKQ